MAGFTWTSEKDKFEAIGFLARPGVVDSISAQVQHKYIEKFKERFAGKYSKEYPYDVGENKYGYQYRIDINHAEGCPKELLTHLEGKYKLRLENNDFIRELVEKYGFVFTNSNQDSREIFNKVSRIGGKEFEWFKSTFSINDKFIESLQVRLVESETSARIIDIKKKAKKVANKKTKQKQKYIQNGFSEGQLLYLGWIGELCVYNELIKRNSQLLEKLKINSLEEYKINWFNNGFQNDNQWVDKSVGQGCDIEIKTENHIIYLEIKSSKQESNIFTMTTNELITMHNKADEYFLIKVNNLEKILSDEAVDILVFDMPYERFFKPENIKEATFKMESEENE